MSIKDTIKSAVKGMPALVTGGQPGYRAGEDKLAWARSDLSGPQNITVRSGAFTDGNPIPLKYSVDGDDVSPPLEWSGLPEGAKSVVLAVEDPDAPTPNPYVHWLLYQLNPDKASLPENVSHDPTLPGLGGALQGKNSGLKLGWTGMAPPKADIAHRYFFQLFALDKGLSLEPGVGRTELFDAMAGHVIARGRIIGTYHR